ncbi:hypothetical protein K6L44_11550 [Gluconacetobacter entanii]|uniref:hypothetical protein n=1 Tax=Gluconacetobacter entanii TaxID=108528 RepID=UPI001C934B57|nr:hypothetical protein [Gluconacetobacter entanii]MBY4640609.1 hypothetical protein [Gluconacetobacter entanii]MCW4578954.1 hypothetical protein [Gluconacetobacter entanii]MCW4585735.1 hypothetical protein [Gluconacetobacter entanii]
MKIVKETFIYDNKTSKNREELGKALSDCVYQKVLSSKNKPFTTEYTLVIEGDEDGILRAKLIW